MAKYTIAFLLYKGFPHGRYNGSLSIVVVKKIRKGNRQSNNDNYRPCKARSFL